MRTTAHWIRSATGPFISSRKSCVFLEVGSWRPNTAVFHSLSQMAIGAGRKSNVQEEIRSVLAVGGHLVHPFFVPVMGPLLIRPQEGHRPPKIPMRFVHPRGVGGNPSPARFRQENGRMEKGGAKLRCVYRRPDDSRMGGSPFTAVA